MEGDEFGGWSFNFFWGEFRVRLYKIKNKNKKFSKIRKPRKCR